MKRPKKVIVKHKETISYYSEYQCPHCHTCIIGASIGKHVTRFICTECNNECIVEKHEFIKK